jgi:hypothetical protein
MGHTKGPWHVNGDCIEADGPEGPRDLTVAMVVPFREERQANAALMASAPELLAALRIADEALDYAQAQVDSERDRKRLLHWRTQVQNAISLAEGKG